jgi:hypothetical protein
MANYRIKAEKTGPRTFKKELQMISYRGSALYSEDGTTLISEKDVFYPNDYLTKGATAVVLDSNSYRKDGLSLGNKLRKGRPAALPIEERFPLQTEVSRSLLGINRAETQQGIFDNVSSYGLERKDWVIYSGWPDRNQGRNWEFKNSPAGPHQATIDRDDAKGSSIVISSYPVPYFNPGNAPIGQRIRGLTGPIGPGWARYIQSLVAMYVIEYMVNNFTLDEKRAFRLEFLESTYPKASGNKFNRLYWDQIWLDISQGRFQDNKNIPIIPQGRLVNFTFPSSERLDIIETFDANVSEDERFVNPTYTNFFFATTRYTWIEPDQGHYRIKTNPNEEVWSEYWGIDYNSLPQALRDWEFGVYESEASVPAFVKTYKLPYYLIESKTPSESLIFGSSWPQSFSDPAIPQIQGALAEGNLPGARESNYAVITLSSMRAFRYQPGRISGFTYGVRISDEGAGPGTILEWGVENFTDGYFFRLRNGTDFGIVRRSTIPLGLTPLFIEAQYEEREAYISQLTGIVRYRDLLSDSEVLRLDEEVREGTQVKVYETFIEQNVMNGDGLNSQGDSGYIYNPSTVTMYKIEFGWYGAIGARFYVYIPQGPGEARWVTLHTLVIENQIGQPCLEDPFFFFKYRAYVDSPSRLRLPQFVEKYGASYYIDGGDEGTVSISSGRASNRRVPTILSDTTKVPTYSWATVLGLKPKEIITNTQGNEFKNKKEIFPISASITSTTPVEIKFVNQFGCKENGYTFQEGYQCVLPEKQRLRGVFQVNKLQKDENRLVALGEDKDSPIPTITYTGPDSNFPESEANLGGEVANFVGWGAFNNSLHGSHLIADKLYTAYLNPTIEGTSSTVGFSGDEIVIRRVTRDPRFNGLAKNRAWSNAELLYRYNEPISIKLSPYRKDTTLLSTVEITSPEFYLLFTKRTARSRDGLGGDCRTEGASIGCDGNHFGDYEIGIIWPKADNIVSATSAVNGKAYTITSAGNTDFTLIGASNNSPGTVFTATGPATGTGQITEISYPDSMISRSRSTRKDFGIINPHNPADRTINNSEVEVTDDNGEGNYYVVDKTIPNPDTYRYYEGLPINFGSTKVRTNVLSSSQAGWLRVSSQGLETSEGLGTDGLGVIDSQFPNIPGIDGGECHAIYGRSGEIQVFSTFTNKNAEGQIIGGRFYLSSTSPWPAGLWAGSEDIFVEEEGTGASIVVKTIEDEPQQQFTPTGTSVRYFLLPVTTNSPFTDGAPVISKYRAIALYETSLLRRDARLLDRKIVGQNIFPIRFFIRMREGSQIGGVTVGQVTPNGIIQAPFTPHGSTLSVNNVDGQQDLHDGGSGDTEASATKSLVAFSHPGSLVAPTSYSYFDISNGGDGINRAKKCPSFISRDLLSGAGFSGVGDYPIRWLEFKESGDPVASYFVSAGSPTEIDLTSVFGINTESVGPNFWGNKALFMISRNIEQGTEGTMSVTLNYKEQ